MQWLRGRRPQGLNDTSEPAKMQEAGPGTAVRPMRAETYLILNFQNRYPKENVHLLLIFT